MPCSIARLREIKVSIDNAIWLFLVVLAVRHSFTLMGQYSVTEGLVRLSIESNPLPYG